MVSKRSWTGLAALTAAALLATGAGLSMAQESPEAATPATKPAEKAAQKPARKRSVRVIKPYSDLKDLSPQQEDGIKAIHAEILDRKAELDRLERERIMALLTDEQKQKVDEIEAERDRQTKERSAAARQRAATRKAAEADDAAEDAGDDNGGM